MNKIGLRIMLRRSILAIALMSLAASPPGIAAADEKKDVASMSIEDLMNIEVTSVSKKGERMQDAAAAIFVVSHEDIVRSGARAIPEVLRLVPGLEVGRVSGNQWSVTSRGESSIFANKLLVLIDGRTVYNPLFSGTFWDMQNPMLEDIDRIEVIRGPGAALWGANAVNGVINIITKTAHDTQGGVFVGGGGSYEHGYTDMRYGGSISKDFDGRVYASFGNRGKTEAVTEEEENDTWRNGQTGFRLDRADGKDKYTLQGDTYRGFSQQKLTLLDEVFPFEHPTSPHVSFAGTNLLGRWTREFEDSSNLQVQLYWDRTSRDDPLVNYRFDTYDLDAQYRFRISSSNEATAGAGVRWLSDDISNDRAVRFAEDSRFRGLQSAFAQDDQSLLDGQLHLIAGIKLEHTRFTGLEAQPSIRSIWHPHEKISLWGAISHAVRTPSRAESDAEFTTAYIPPGTIPDVPIPGLVNIIGSSELSSETLNAFEAGVRGELSRNLSFDVVGFLNRANNIIGIEGVNSEVSLDGGTPHLLVTDRFTNLSSIHAFGVEPVLSWQALPWWRLQGWYTFLDESSKGSGEQGSMNIQNDPRDQFALRSTMDLSETVEADALLRYVDRVPSYGIPAYTELNARIAYKPSKDVELSIGVTNLLNPQHEEFAAEFIHYGRTSVPRSVVAQLKWNF